MSRLRSTLSLIVALSLAAPTVALAGPPPPPPKGAATAPDQPPDPDSISPEEKINWAKKLFKEASAAHESGDFYQSVVKFEQAYVFAPDKHIFAFNIGQDAWELRDCARVKQYLGVFLDKETAKEDLRKKAQELLARADGNAECVTGNVKEEAKPPPPKDPVVGTDLENPLDPTGKGPPGGDPEAPAKRGSSGLLIGGVILTVAGIGAAGAGIGTMFLAKTKNNAVNDAADVSAMTNFPQGSFDESVRADMKSVKTLNVVSPMLIAVGGAMLLGGVVMIVVDRQNKKHSRGFYAAQPPRVQLSGLGAAPLPGGGAAGSFALRF